jgi:lysophospholipase
MTTPQTLTHLPSLRTPPSTYSRHVRYTLHEFPTLLDSSSISSAGWSQIASCIQANYSLFDGFVVLHGTDSLAYTSSALSFMLENLGKPVVLTGSQASIFALQSDAVDNLLGSLILAGTFMIPEVCLFFHHNLYRGNRATVCFSSLLPFADCFLGVGEVSLACGGWTSNACERTTDSLFNQSICGCISSI